MKAYDERRVKLGCEPLWGVEEVADYLGVSERSVARLDIPRVALGPQLVRFDPDTVRRWARLRLTVQLPDEQAA